MSYDVMVYSAENMKKESKTRQSHKFSNFQTYLIAGIGSCFAI